MAERADSQTPTPATAPPPARRPPQGDHPPGWRVEGAPPDPNDKSPTRRFRPPGARFWWILLGLLLVNWLIVSQFAPGRPNRLEVPYTTFRAQVEQGNVTEVTSRGDAIQGEFKEPVTYPAPKAGEKAPKGDTSSEFETTRPAFADDGIFELLDEQDVVVNARPIEEGRSLLAQILLFFGPTLLLIGLFVFLARRAGGMGGALTSIGRSRAKRYEATSQRTTFDDVAGIDEAEDELVEIVDFLKNPDKYRRLGGQIPRGVLPQRPARNREDAARPRGGRRGGRALLLALGLGVHRDDRRRRREPRPRPLQPGQGGRAGDHLHRRAGRDRAHARRRGGARWPRRARADAQPDPHRDGRFHRHRGRDRDRGDEPARDPRPGAPAPRTLRPARRRQPPRPAGPQADPRGAHARRPARRRRRPRVDRVHHAGHGRARISRTWSTRRRSPPRDATTSKVELADFTDAFEKIILGAERKIMLSPEERERTAFHESGHALLGMLQPGADPVRKVSIVPRGRALGVTFQSPEADRYGYDAAYLRGRIIGALGGRAAEELVYGNVTTGAESDLEQVTRIARQMVGRWGMSEAIGPVSVLPGPNDEPLLFPGTGGGVSDAHARADRRGGSPHHRGVLRDRPRPAAREPRQARRARAGAARARDARRARRVPRGGNRAPSRSRPGRRTRIGPTGATLRAGRGCARGRAPRWVSTSRAGRVAGVGAYACGFVAATRRGWPPCR